MVVRSLNAVERELFIARPFSDSPSCFSCTEEKKMALIDAEKSRRDAEQLVRAPGRSFRFAWSLWPLAFGLIFAIL